MLEIHTLHVLEVIETIPILFHGPHILFLVQGCSSDDECSENEACLNGKCASPCACGVNAICEVTFHKPLCTCPPGYIGNPTSRCEPPTNPCEPNPCGINAFCELDNGNPICYCPKGLTGNPFKNCSKYFVHNFVHSTAFFCSARWG